MSTIQASMEAVEENNEPLSPGKRKRLSTSSETVGMPDRVKRERSMSNESFEVIEHETSPTVVENENANLVEPEVYPTKSPAVENEVSNLALPAHGGPIDFTSKPTTAIAESSESAMTPEERKETRRKEILYLRHRLQKGFLSRDRPLQEEEMASMSDHLKNLESYRNLESEVFRTSKIHNVVKAILKLNCIPKEEEFNFKQRFADLLEEWNSVISSNVEPPPQVPAETNQKEPGSSLPGERMDADAQGGDESTASDQTTHQKPQSALVVFDSTGDRELIIRDMTWKSDMRVLVSSSCLRKITHFWESLPGPSTEQPVIEVWDYSWDLIRILLHVAHGNTDDVPELLPLNELWDVAHLSVDYDVVELMRPYLRNWAWPRMPAAVKDSSDYAEWLFFSWFLGYGDTFEAVIRKVAMIIGPDPEDFFAGVFSLTDEQQKARRIIIDNVSRIRSGIMNEIITVCHGFDERLSGKSCKETPPSESCESVAYGSLIRGLSSMDPPLWPQRPEPQHLDLSVNDLILKLADVQILSGHEYCDHNADFHGNLALCLSSDNAVSGVKSLPVPVSGFVALEAEHNAHFRSFGLKASEDDPLVWRSNAIARMGFVERDAVGLVYEMHQGTMGLRLAGDVTKWDYDSEEEEEEEWDDEGGKEAADEMDTGDKEKAADGDDSDEEDPHWKSDYDSVTEPEEEFLEMSEASDYDSQ
ncbi:hypothetical protein BU16DRAFT_578033 [Lophium mytilinum]|uniref:BTB domain-containing protein n=1 Tax=Lophium mytilinum TaxID=390894 RepID=A0A6A6R5D4_9PEZI|nr:hypothetical protein BU16DRAFT_578033 [Lophium mytilinum]